MKVTAYTDGSCYYKTQLGGYGIFIEYEDREERLINKGYSNTTTGRMELRGAIRCLKEVDKNHELTVYCDALYVVNCIKERWLFIWEKRKFIGCKNEDLLKQFLEEYRKFKTPPKFKHIKGHTGKNDENSLKNSIADALADYKQFKEYEEDGKD